MNSTSIYKCSIMLVLRGWCFLRDFSPIVHLLSSLVFPANYYFVTRANRVVFYFSILVASLNFANKLRYSQQVLFREGYPRELAYSSSFSQRTLELGRVLLLMTARLQGYSRIRLKINQNKK